MDSKVSTVHRHGAKEFRNYVTGNEARRFTTLLYFLSWHYTSFILYSTVNNVWYTCMTDRHTQMYRNSLCSTRIYSYRSISAAGRYSCMASDQLRSQNPCPDILHSRCERQIQLSIPQPILTLYIQNNSEIKRHTYSNTNCTICVTLPFKNSNRWWYW